MRKSLSLAGAAMIAAIAVIGTLLIEHQVIVKEAEAQTGSIAGGYVLYAGVRKDTEKNESFIFFNPQTGDIWVYEDDEAKEHFRLNKVGENLLRLKH
jgi:hypothetical protein